VLDEYAFVDATHHTRIIDNKNVHLTPLTD
jgi:hypothetical protein